MKKGHVFFALSVVFLIMSFLSIHRILPRWSNSAGSYDLGPGNVNGPTVGLLYGSLVELDVSISGANKDVYFYITDSNGARARMKQMEQSKTMCVCTNCPSYRGTGETELLFCGIGKSSIIKEEKGCSCGLCPVVAHMGLTRLYYCTRGNEKQQRGV